MDSPTVYVTHHINSIHITIGYTEIIIPEDYPNRFLTIDLRKPDQQDGRISEVDKSASYSKSTKGDFQCSDSLFKRN